MAREDAVNVELATPPATIPTRPEAVSTVKTAASRGSSALPLAGETTERMATNSLARTAVAGRRPPEVAPAVGAAVEAVLVEEETDGKVTYRAPSEYWQLATSEDKLEYLRDLPASQPERASAELLSLFNSETDAEMRQHILSMATLLPRDQYTRLLWSSALSPNQPIDVRRSAVAHASDEERDLLLGYRNDRDETLRDEIASALEPSLEPDESKVIRSSAGIRKPPAGTASPRPARNNN